MCRCVVRVRVQQHELCAIETKECDDPTSQRKDPQHNSKAAIRNMTTTTVQTATKAKILTALGSINMSANNK